MSLITDTFGYCAFESTFYTVRAHTQRLNDGIASMLQMIRIQCMSTELQYARRSMLVCSSLANINTDGINKNLTLKI